MFSILYSLFKKQDFLRFGRVCLLAIFTAFWEVITTFIIMLFAQTLTNPTSFTKWCEKFSLLLPISQALMVVACLFVVTYLIKSLLSFWESRFQSRFIENCAQDMRLSLFNVYSNMTYTHYISRNTSQFSTSLTLDVYDAFQRGLASLTRIISESFVVIMLLFFALIIRPKLFIGLFGLSSIVGLLVKYYLFPRIYEGGKKVLAARTDLHQDTMQFIQSFKDVRLFGKENLWRTHIMRASWKESNAEDQQRILSIIPRLVLESVFAILLGSAMVFVQDISVLGVYVYIGFRLLPASNRIVTEANQIKHILGRLERFHAELTTTPQENIIACPHFLFQKAIVFDNVSFAYPGRSLILNDASLSIQKGECVGFIGKSGSGKSTVLDLLLGLLMPTSGTIIIDETFPPYCYEWRQTIGYVSQAISLIDQTLAYNVALGEPDLQKVAKVLKQAQFLFDDLPEGLQTRIGERGIRLSGGERQRIAIARALYKNPSILIFDEATSALDPVTELQLMETLYNISQNYTVLMVAHRYDTLKKCHKIYRVENGLIVLHEALN